MRLPSEAELSKEQREACNLDPEGINLVVGPPGSGKTVVAIFTKNILENIDEEVTATAWNNVLAVYGGMELTFEKWLGKWWHQLTGQRFPSYKAEGEYRYLPDYSKAMELAGTELRDEISRNSYWGQLILDEAQDLPEEAHSFMALILKISEGASLGASSLLVLADENQRLSSRSASISQIEKALFLTKERIYELKANYRNTEQIAKFSRCFFTGTKSGIPDLPNRQGDRPKLFKGVKTAASVDKIANFIETFPDQEIGVLVNYTRQRKRFLFNLKKKLKGKRITVQTYGSSSEEKKNVSKMKFDKGGVVTVLCYASAKGLEFDHVFLPELHQLPVGQDEDFLAQKMNLYVMTSRAREGLTLMMDDEEKKSDFWRLMPNDNELHDLIDVRD